MRYSVRPLAEPTPGLAWRLTILLSLLGSVSLVLASELAGPLWDRLGELGLLGFTLVAALLFAGGGVTSVVWLAARLRAGRADGLVPIAINLSALAFCFSPSVGYQMDMLNFGAYLAERNEVVERIAVGELWSGRPSDSIAFLPQEYPTAVSNGAGQRAVVVYRADTTLCVVFYPVRGLLKGVLNETSAFMHCSNGAPTLPNSVLPYAFVDQSLGEGWYRLVFRSR